MANNKNSLTDESCFILVSDPCLPTKHMWILSKGEYICVIYSARVASETASVNQYLISDEIHSLSFFVWCPNIFVRAFLFVLSLRSWIPNSCENADPVHVSRHHLSVFIMSWFLSSVHCTSFPSAFFSIFNFWKGGSIVIKTELQSFFVLI